MTALELRAQGHLRNGHWRAVRSVHLKANPECAVCGGRFRVEAHHIKPFHTHRELELVMSNLITLCESKRNGINCHLAFGHLGDYKSWNSTVVEDAKHWSHKLKHRP